MEKLFIIIVTYNAEKWLDKCLSPFLDMPKEWQIVVVDNGSEDNTVSLLENKFPFVRLIVNKKNLGFGQANNIGLKIALQEQADYVLLLNQDAYIDQKNIFELMHVSQANPEYYILCPMQYNGDKTNLDTSFKLYIKNLNDYFYDLILNKVKEIYPLKFNNAACWFMPIECVNKVGGFSPVFFHYGEDNNYCDRVEYYGKKIGIVPHTFFCHDREFREPNKIYWNDVAYNYRVLLRETTNPGKLHKKHLFEKVFLKLIKKILRYSLVFDLKKAKYYINLLKLYYKDYPLIKDKAPISLKDRAYLEE